MNTWIRESYPTGIPSNVELAEAFIDLASVSDLQGRQIVLLNCKLSCLSSDLDALRNDVEDRLVQFVALHQETTRVIRGQQTTLEILESQLNNLLNSLRSSDDDANWWKYPSNENENEDDRN